MTYVEEAAQIVKSLSPDKAQAVIEFARYLAWKDSGPHAKIAADLDTAKLEALIEELAPERAAADTDPEL